MVLDIVILAFFMLVLLGCEWLGYHRWIRRYEPGLSRPARALLGLVILTLAGGFIGAFAWWAAVPGSFAWDPPPLASRMLAAAGWSFALLSYTTITRPTYRRVRLYLWMLGVYMWPLTAAILFFHLDRFDFGAAITYPFFAVVVILNAGPAWFLIRQPRVLPDDAPDELPAGPGVQAWLALVAFVTGLWSLALFVTDSGPIAMVWTWPGDLLTSRLIASMLLTICVGALFGLRRADTAQVALGVIVLYGLGLATASAWNMLDGRPVNLAYLVAFGLMGTGSAWLLVPKRRTAWDATTGANLS